MKKILSLVLVVVMIMAMAIPAFAASEDDVAPCAVTCTSHTVNNPINTAYKYSCGEAEPGKNCIRKTYTTYQCGNCHEIFTVLTATTNVNHVGSPISATCNGTYQTVRYKCTNCKCYYTDDSVRCPGAGHISGNCNWLPV